MSLFRKTLVDAKLPTPSGIMTDLICLKIAGMLPDDRWATQSDFFFLPIPLQDGKREIEVRAEFSPIAYHHIRSDCRVRNVTVGLPGKPCYRSVDLSGEEQDKIKFQIDALIQRSQAALRLRRDANSQSAALDIIEGLIS